MLNGCGFFGRWLDTSQGHNNALLLDTVCRRYGIAPHEYLKESIGVLSIDAKIALIGAQHERELAKKAADEAKHKAKLEGMMKGRR